MKAAVALEKLLALVGRQVKITMLDGSTPSGEMTDVMTQGLVINDGDDGEILWPSSIELDNSFTHPLSSIARIDLAAASNVPSPKVIDRQRGTKDKAVETKPVKPTRTHKFKEE